MRLSRGQRIRFNKFVWDSRTVDSDELSSRTRRNLMHERDIIRRRFRL
jgi:hypothetical protein